MILGPANPIINLLPWGGPTGRVAAALHVDMRDVFVPPLPTIGIGVIATAALPLPVVFMAGVTIALLVNYPQQSDQRERIAACAPNALPILLLMGQISRSSGSINKRYAVLENLSRSQPAHAYNPWRYWL